MWLDGNDLKARLRRGDGSVLADIENDVWPAIWWQVRRRFGGCVWASDRDDLMQDSLLIFWDTRGNYDASRGSVQSWFAGIAFNVARDFAKARRTRQRQCEKGVEPDCLRDLAVATFPDEDDDEAVVSADILRLRLGLSELSAREQALILARYASNGPQTTARELARELQMEPDAVRKAISRAMKRLRNVLERQDNACHTVTKY